MSDDWLEELDEKFAHLEGEGNDEVVGHKAKLTEKLMGMFFGLWVKFDIDRGVRMQLTPFEWEFVDYKDQKEWRLDKEFNFGEVADIELLDARFPYKQGLRAELYRAEETTRIRLAFLLEDWREKERKGFTPFLLYDAPVEAARVSDIWKEMKKVALPWHEAHIRGDQEHLWDWVKSTYVDLPRR
ncbi:MAG: hypothetical protein KAT70_09170 [Thermoplasmata archaeon]|nr:hypothetical protein [Thermoplasmata archaeon]